MNIIKKKENKMMTCYLMIDNQQNFKKENYVSSDELNFEMIILCQE